MFDLSSAPASPQIAASALAATLDEIDYGLLLLDSGGRVAYVNHVAHAKLDAGHALQLRGNSLCTRHPHDAGPLQDALAAARERGLRRLITLGGGDTPRSCKA